ncbi:hypothetical protein Vadar_019918 [Vaccinium darrowii]|uniref:Uncharacterized protein n=1 Tax=Vaccinium darrowii TaxID=229202 RepID=A0ACB7YN11_9ERIC|nr:hypothetical protein Vadar_019918 [Vaccinium darrowii]
MASSHRDWASLPLDIIYSIREKLVQFSDYVRFIAVCQQWRHCLEQDTGDYKQRLHILNAKVKDFYAVSYWDELLKIDIASGTEKVLTKKSAVNNAQVTYLVQSQDGDLLLVQRFWTEPFKYSDNPDEKIMDKTFRFAVFKLLHPTGETGATWVQIKSLGEQALFLGDNHSLSVSKLEFPECLPNCIYYTEQYHVEFGSLYFFPGVDEDSGIFHLEEGSFRTHYISDPFGKNVLPPIWFVPNMKGT